VSRVTKSPPAVARVVSPVSSGCLQVTPGCMVTTVVAACAEEMKEGRREGERVKEEEEEVEVEEAGCLGEEEEEAAEEAAEAGGGWKGWGEGFACGMEAKLETVQRNIG